MPLIIVTNYQGRDCSGVDVYTALAAVVEALCGLLHDEANENGYVADGTSGFGIVLHTSSVLVAVGASDMLVFWFSKDVQ
ncbi:hypothetical protein Tco_0367726 [Tanacetum coccineum]